MLKISAVYFKWNPAICQDDLVLLIDLQALTQKKKNKILLYLALLYFNSRIKQNWINSYLGFAIRGILRNFATKNIAKGREGIVHGLIVNSLVEIFDKNISNTRSTKARITLAPHNTDWTAFQNVKIHCIQSSFGCKEILYNLIGFH